MQIRLATLLDLDVIREIYNDYVVHSTCTFAIELETAEERLAWFKERTSAHPVIVAEESGKVVGWAALSPWKSRCGYSHSVEASVYIDRDWHRRGIGKLLLQDLIDHAKQIGHHTIIGGACTEHPGSIALQKSLGFQDAGYFHQTGRKFDRWLDVQYLQLML